MTQAQGMAVTFPESRSMSVAELGLAPKPYFLFRLLYPLGFSQCIETNLETGETWRQCMYLWIKATLEDGVVKQAQ